MNPNMASASAPSWISPWPPVVEQATQISMASLAPWPSGINMVSCENPDQGQAFLWPSVVTQPWKSTQTPAAAVGS